LTAAQQLSLKTGSVYVKTSGTKKSCKKDADCFEMREPNEWCPMPHGNEYFDKGCFCDGKSESCFIERAANGKGSEHTDCADKASSKCLNAKLGGKQGKS